MGKRARQTMASTHRRTAERQGVYNQAGMSKDVLLQEGGGRCLWGWSRQQAVGIQAGMSKDVLLQEAEKLSRHGVARLLLKYVGVQDEGREKGKKNCCTEKAL